jgi:hypothetical protein
MRDLRSAHFVIERTGAPAYVDPGNTIIFRQAEGDFAAPDQARVAVRVIGPALVVEVHVVSLGDQYWETNPVTGAWVSYPGMGYNPVALFDPQTGLSALMRHSLTNLKMAGLASLDDFPGERFFHLTAEAPGDPVRAMTAGMIGRGRVTFDWWIQSVTHYLTRVRIVEPETDPADPTVWIVDLEAFNEPVTITPPAP